MSVKLRLARAGAKKHPFYRIVVTDEGSPRDGRFIENVGTYDPGKNPPAVKVDQDRVRHWIGLGAQPTRTVSQILRRIPPVTPAETPPQKAAVTPPETTAATA